MQIQLVAVALLPGLYRRTPGGHSDDAGGSEEDSRAALRADDEHSQGSARRSRCALRYLATVGSRHARFRSPEDVQSIIPLVKDYLASSEPEFWVVSSADGAVMGFMGLSGSKMEALFLAPEFRGRGAGRLLVQHARTLRGELTTDVNEQNHAARRFYEGCGFVVEGRSELDDMGRPILSCTCA